MVTSDGTHNSDLSAESSAQEPTTLFSWETCWSAQLKKNLPETSLMTRTLTSTSSTLVNYYYQTQSRTPLAQLQFNATSPIKPTPSLDHNTLVKWKRDFSESWTTLCQNRELLPSTLPLLKERREMLPSTSVSQELERLPYQLTPREWC